MTSSSDESNRPPPLPSVPPPLPGAAPPLPADVPGYADVPGEPEGEGQPRHRWLITGILLGVGVIVVVAGMMLAFALIFVLTAEELELSEEQKACVVKIEDLQEWFEIDVNLRGETWDADRFYDGSVEVYYLYEDLVNESIQLSCSLTIECTPSDALMAYGIEWGGLKMTNRLFNEEQIELEMADDVFSWGEQSRFAFQTIGGERHGFAFVGRKETRVFFVDCWGVLLEDAEEISEFLTPHLKAFESETFSTPRQSPGG